MEYGTSLNTYRHKEMLSLISTHKTSEKHNASVRVL